MSPDPDHLIPEDDGPSPLDPEGLAPFGGQAFGEGAFGAADEGAGTPGTGPGSGETILQRHKVDKLLTGYSVTRRRYQAYQDKWASERRAENARLAKIKRQEDARKRRELAERRARVDFRLAALNARAADANLDALFMERLAALDRQAMLAQIEREAVAAMRAGQMQMMLTDLAMQHQQRAEQEEEAEVLELLMAA
jgi:hypothetical protein